MPLSANSIARLLTLETGLIFKDSRSWASLKLGFGEKERQVEIFPEGYSPSRSFVMRGMVGWRHLEVTFCPGNFAGDLVKRMGQTDELGRLAFVEGMRRCIGLGATVRLLVNEVISSFDDETIWDTEWSNIEVSIRKGHLDFESMVLNEEEDLVLFWMTQLMTGILAMLPVEEANSSYEEPGTTGFPEGVLTQIKVNKYERDPRNRAAALAIHGRVCLVCEQDLSHVYGSTGIGAIEVHHAIPVSQLGEDYEIDPSKDLIPLCPNCHTVVHRRDPPYSIEELKDLRVQAQTQRT